MLKSESRANFERPSTTCQTYRPSLASNDPKTSNNNPKKCSLTRSYTFDAGSPIKVLPSSSATLEQPSQRVGRSLLSNDNWRKETMNDFRINSKAIEQSDQNILYGKGVDPVPHVRELVSELSNQEAFRYARQCRLVVSKLRLCHNDINEEIKSLLKHKEYTEATIEHIRKDLIINKESVNLRKKPKREAEPDGVDDMLAAEKYHLNSLKKVLELNCKNILDQMQKLDEVRQRASKVGRERALVTELICQCLTSASRAFEVARTGKKEQNPTGQSGVPIRPTSAFGYRSPHSNNNNNNNYTSRSTTNLSSNLLRGSPEASLLDENGLPIVNHLSAFTPDVIQVFQDAAKSIDESREIKKQAMNQITDAFNDAKSYSLTVNQSIAQKLADIITLAQHLTISLGENMLAKNRAGRWLDLTVNAQKLNAGPLSSSYLKIPERLDRPIIRTFQKHPGNQLPDAQILSGATKNLQQSAEESKKQLKTLKIVGQRLKANLVDKEAALEVDSHLLRRRREQSNHKWSVTKYVHV